MQKRFWFCFVVLVSGLNVRGAVSGTFRFQNGDQIEGLLSSITPEGIFLGEEKPVTVNKGWLLRWRSSPAEQPATGSAQDRITLVSGQALEGAVLSMSADMLVFRTVWDQKMEVARSLVSRIEPLGVREESWIDPATWRLRGREDLPLASKETGWYASGGRLSHDAAKGQAVSKSYQGSFSSFELVYDFEFPEGDPTYVVVLDKGETSNEARANRINLYSSGSNLRWSDGAYRQNSMLLPMRKEGMKTRPARIRVRVQYDLKQQEVRIYRDGELEATQRIFVDPSAGPFLQNPDLTLQVRSEKPLIIHRLGLRKGLRPVFPDVAEDTSAGVLLQNGDRLPAEVVSLEEKMYRLKLGETVIPIPGERIRALQLRPNKTKPRQSLIQVGLHQVHSVLQAEKIVWGEDQVVILLPGVDAPLTFPVTSVAEIIWPRETGLPRPKDAFRFHLVSDQKVTGQIQSLDSESVTLLPPWTTVAQTLSTKELKVIAATAKHSEPAVRPCFILRNGDRVRGVIKEVGPERIGVEDAVYGSAEVLRSHVRTVLQPGDRDGNWILDVLQTRRLLPPPPGMPYIQTSITEDGGLRFPKSLLIRQPLPTQTPGVYLRAVFSEFKQLSFSARLDYALKDGKRHGLFMTFMRSSLSIWNGRKGNRKVSFDENQSGKAVLELFLQRKSGQVRIVLNGKELLNDVVQEAVFLPDASSLILNGFQHGVTVEELWVLPWDGQGAPEQHLPGSEPVTRLWLESGFAGEGRLVSYSEGGAAFQTPDMEQPKPLSSDSLLGLRFSPEPFFVSAPSAVTFQLRDAISELHGTGIHLLNGRMILEHEAFPDGFSVPLSDVYRIQFR